MDFDLTLYKFDDCPFCFKVMKYLEERGIKIPMKDIKKHPEFREELIQLGGKSQAPCLMINGKALYESDDIIDWFEINWK